jgi:hypothetical protein
VQTDLLTPQASFDAISERLLVGPVVRTLVYSKIPNTVCDWVDRICADWRFERIIPAHFSSPVKAGGWVWLQPGCGWHSLQPVGLSLQPVGLIGQFAACWPGVIGAVTQPNGVILCQAAFCMYKE